MKTLVIVLLCAVLADARWSFYSSKADHDHDHDHELDWWEHGVFYQVKYEIKKLRNCFNKILNRLDLSEFV